MRVVLISGASSGFGTECAHAFAARGYRVIATMRWTDKSPFAQGKAIEVRALDVTDPRSIKTCVASVLADHGRIDVLVNNAGIHLSGAMEDMSDAELRGIFETNFFGAINLARAVLPSMREHGQGHVISVSSIGARIGRVTDGAYCASKAALELAMESMRSEVARVGVHVSVVAPGAFRTSIGRNFHAEFASESSSPYRDLQEFRREKVRAAIDQGGDPAEVAKLIADIADDPAPAFRYVVGERAIAMDKTLATLEDAERQDLIAQLSDIEWWLKGADRP